MRPPQVDDEIGPLKLVILDSDNELKKKRF